MLRECISRSSAEEHIQQGGCRLLPLSAIRFKCGKRLNKKKIARIKRHLDDGGATLPVKVVENDKGGFKIVGEGRHRIAAHLEAEKDRILCRIAA